MREVIGLISRFEAEVKLRDDHQCVFMSVGEMKLVIKSLKRFKRERKI